MQQQDVTQRFTLRTARWLAMLAVAGVLLALSSLTLLAAQSAGLVTQDLTNLTAQQLAETLVGSNGDVTISNVVYTGTNAAAGTFSGGEGIIGFDKGIILSTGHITSVVGPNTGTIADNMHQTAGDPQLTALAGQQTHDAAVLTFDFVPQGDKVFFNFVFSSEEYNEYVGDINDVFAFYVNGTNCAVVKESGKPVSINSINRGTSGTDEGPTSSHPELFRNNPAAADGTSPINTGMNGLTTVLTCEATVNPGVTNSMKLAIADSSDVRLDSNVFIEAGSLSTIPPTPTPTSVAPTATPPAPTPTEATTPTAEDPDADNSHGDVHIFTPDGLIFDFQATGDFIAAQSSDGKVIVQARQETSPVNSTVSLNTALALWVDGDKVEFYVKSEPRFYVNDEAQAALPSSSYALANGGSIDPISVNDSRAEYLITWPDGSFKARLIMYLNSHMDYGVAGLGSYAGLLGNHDGNAQNDLQLRAGDQIKSPPSVDELNRFGDSWRVPADESLFHSEDAAEQQHTIVNIAEEDRAQAEEICQNGGVSDELALRNCIYDVAVTDDPIFVESAKQFEASTKDLPPSAKVPATAGETLGGAIFDANQAVRAGITILDGDDLIITTGTADDGTGYMRFNVYRSGAYVVSFSVGTDGDVADAVAAAMVETIVPDGEGTDVVAEPVAPAPVAGDPNTWQCRDGLARVREQLSSAAETTEWRDIYAEIEQEFLVGCAGLDQAFAQAANQVDIAEVLGIGEGEVELLNIFEGMPDTLNAALVYTNEQVNLHCPDSSQGVECSDILNAYDLLLRLMIGLLDYMND